MGEATQGEEAMLWKCEGKNGGGDGGRGLFLTISGQVLARRLAIARLILFGRE